MSKSTISFYMSNELIQKIRKLAEENERSVSFTIMKLIEKALGDE